VAVTTAWDMLVWGELPAADVVGCIASVLPGEHVDSLIEPFLGLAVDAASNWSPDSLRDSLMAQMAAEGKCIVMISSEMPELLGMCDRIYVMNEGRFVGEFEAREASQEKIMRAIVKQGAAT